MRARAAESERRTMDGRRNHSTGNRAGCRAEGIFLVAVNRK